MSRKKRVRLQAAKVKAVAAAYGLKGNAGFRVIADAISKKTRLPFAIKREDAKALIAAQPEYGTVFPDKPKKEKTPRPGINPASDAFLLSYEWRRVRMQALKKYGSRCQCCGATPADGLRMNVDHIKPRKLFPQLALDVNNLQVLCEVCNHGKGNWDMTDWRDAHEPVNPDIGEAERQHIRSIMEGK